MTGGGVYSSIAPGSFAQVMSNSLPMPFFQNNLRSWIDCRHADPASCPRRLGVRRERAGKLPDMALGERYAPDFAAFRHTFYITGISWIYHVDVTDLALRLKQGLLTLVQQVDERARELSDTMKGLPEANERLQEIANHDPATGIANRRYWYQRSSDEWKRSSRDNVSLSLVVVAADHFKSVTRGAARRAIRSSGSNSTRVVRSYNGCSSAGTTNPRPSIFERWSAMDLLERWWHNSRSDRVT